MAFFLVLGDDEQSDYYNEPGPAAGSASWSDINNDGDVCADSKQHEVGVDNVCEVRTSWYFLAVAKFRFCGCE